MSVFTVAMSEEHNAIRNIGKHLLQKMEYQQLFK